MIKDKRHQRNNSIVYLRDQITEKGNFLEKYLVEKIWFKKEWKILIKDEDRIQEGRQSKPN